MAITTASLRRGSSQTPPAIMLYSPEGIGKTTLAAGAPNVVFAQFEEGLGVIEADNFGILKTFQDFMDVIKILATEETGFQNLCVDSLDWLEPIVWAEACKRNRWKEITDPGYGEGYDVALSIWRQILDCFTMLRNERNIGIILLAHAAIRKFESPETAPYDHFTPKLHESAKGKGANPLIREHVDFVGFMNWRTSTMTDKTSNNKKDVGHTRGIGGGQRLLYTERRPAFIAKNRWSMPPEIMLPDNPDPAANWQTLAQFIPYYARSLNIQSAAE